MINLPKEFGIPRCVQCGVDWYTDDLIKKMEQTLENEYLQHADLIKSITEFYNHQRQK
jgi:hypothetical protein